MEKLPCGTSNPPTVPMAQPTINSGILLREESIWKMMEYFFPTIHLDVMSFVATFPDDIKTPPNLAALSILTEGHPRMGPSERYAHNVIQLCAVGYPDGMMHPAVEYLPRFTRGIRNFWDRIPESAKATVGPLEWHLYVDGVAAEGNEPAVPPVNINERQLRDLMVAMGQAEGAVDTAVCAFTTGQLAICKMGEVTQNVLRKVRDALREEKQINYAVDPDTIRQVWLRIKRWFNHEYSSHFFSQYERSIGDGCPRLRLLTQLAPWFGITNYRNIVEAFERFPDFKWGAAYHIIKNDFAKFADAKAAVNGDPYYGYRSDLGAARSTLYPSLSFLARELLVEVGGDMSLRHYKGTNANVMLSAFLIKLVRDYRQSKANKKFTD